MRTIRKWIVPLVAMPFVFVHGAQAVNGVRLSIEGTNVVLRWPSQPNQTFIVGYRPAFSAETPWTFFTNSLPAAAGSETTFTHSGAFQPGEGQQMASASRGDSAQRQAIVLTAEERQARVEASRESVKKAIAYLTAQLEAAVARANATREQRLALLRAGLQPVATTQSDGSGGGVAAAQMAPGSMGFYLVAEYAEDSDGDGLANGCEVYIGDNILMVDSDGDTISDGAEDTDGDGVDDFTECMIVSDPLVPDSGPLPPLTDGLVLSGQYDITFTSNPNYTNILGPLLFCNNNVTADGLVTTEPSPGHLRLNWNSTFIHYEPFFGPEGQPEDAGQELTDAERAALRDAFGQGTDMDLGRLSTPNQAKVDALPEHVLDYYQNVASEQLRKEFQLIQEVNTGVRPPPPGITLERYMKIRLNQIHTQFTRLQSVNSSLFRRFGRAVNRILPFLGGIIILANADTIAAEFLSAMQDYAHDILNGDDETGSAAILAGRCNDLAPGSGNIALNYLLR